MILIYKGKGILVPVFVLLPIIPLAIISGILNRNIGGVFAVDYDGLIILGLSLLFTSFLTKISAIDYTRDDNGNKIFVSDDFTFFWIKLKFWWIIFLISGSISVIIGIYNTIIGQNYL